MLTSVQYRAKKNNKCNTSIAIAMKKKNVRVTERKRQQDAAISKGIKKNDIYTKKKKIIW
jgi:hypothetical protein